MIKSLIILFIMILVFSVYTPADAGWILYDNFDSDVIDTEKWRIDDSSADISIENGEVRFSHKQGYKRVSSWLIIIDNPQNVIGIRTQIRIESCNGEVRGRAGGWVGKLGENLLWSSIRARPDKGTVETNINLTSPAPMYQQIHKIFFGHFLQNDDNPMDITGKTFILELKFSPDKVVFKAEEVDANTMSYGEIIFKHPVTVGPNAEHFKGIGTRSNKGEGPCLVYFDDVYVYRRAPSAAINTLLLD